MTKRKGIHWYVLVCMMWLTPVMAEDTAEDIVAMMDWWEEYGRYWDEIGADPSSGNAEMFALLEHAPLPQEGSE